MKRRGPRLVGILAACAILGAGSYFAVAQTDDPGSVSPVGSTGESIPADVPAGQASALADGIVTFQELEDAVAGKASCIRAGGDSVTTIPGSGLRPTRLMYIIAATGPDDAAAVRKGRAVVSACSAEHLDLIGATWSGQKTQPDASTIRSLRERLVNCVSSGGASEGTTRMSSDTVVFGIVVGYAADDGSGPRAPADADRDVVEACDLAIEASTGWLMPGDS